MFKVKRNQNEKQNKINVPWPMPAIVSQHTLQGTDFAEGKETGNICYWQNGCSVEKF